MVVYIALRRSSEDNARLRAGSAHRDSIESAQRMLGFSGAGSSSSSRVGNLPFPITGLIDFDPTGNMLPCCGKEKIRTVDACLVEEMAAVEAADAAAQATAMEEAIRACILKKRQQRNMRALAREHNMGGS
ncbi:E3 ubiquitin-protein ligase XB3 [Hordeum vulgare]|nr:E3 ubiquitin-protein ligase XB3 [Hordeum vulgare]